MKSLRIVFRAPDFREIVKHHNGEFGLTGKRPDRRRFADSTLLHRWSGPPRNVRPLMHPGQPVRARVTHQFHRNPACRIAMNVEQLAYGLVGEDDERHDRTR